MHHTLCQSLFRQHKLCRKTKASTEVDALFMFANPRLEGADDVGEDIADSWAKQRQDDDDDDSHQDQDQRIFYEALALFTWKVQHDDFSLYQDKCAPYGVK